MPRGKNYAPEKPLPQASKKNKITQKPKRDLSEISPLACQKCCVDVSMSEMTWRRQNKNRSIWTRLKDDEKETVTPRALG
jgi:hypothetical protein